MKRILFPTLGAFGFSLWLGCASFSTSQTESVATNGVKLITTKVSSHTFFDAHSDLTKFKALQTDKTQSATVGALGQESTGTNAVAILRAMAELANALPK